jgi:hypothetical protein
MPKKAYLCFVLWLSSFTLVPIVIISIRHKIVTGQTQFWTPTFWGLIVVLLLLVGVYALLREIAKNNKHRSWAIYILNSTPILVVSIALAIMKMLEQHAINVLYILGFTLVSVIVGTICKVYYDIEKAKVRG